MKTVFRRQCATLGLFLAAMLAGTVAHASLADQESGISTGTLIAELAFLVVVGACVLTALKIFVSVRGGSIALGWRWIVAGLGLLGLAQLVLIGQHIGVFSMAELWAESLRVLALLLVFIGAAHIRKLLA